jgi:hypothetical protein
MQKFRTNNVNDTELVYSVLREQYPDRQIDIEFNDNTKEYTLCLTDKKYTQDPEVPVDLNIKVVYGDSVTGDTPLLLKKNDLVYIETISSIFDESKKQEYPGFKIFDKTVRLEKEYSTSDYQIWTDIGWVNIKRVIRHKCDKKIYNILTHTGYVSVTEDHSLINESGNIIKPNECNLDTCLLTRYPDEFTSNCSDISVDKAYIYGFFYGDGSCDRYKCPSGLKNSWALNNSDLNLLYKLKDIMIRVYPELTPVIYDTIKSSGVYKLTVKNQKVLVEEFRSKFYSSDRLKRIPTEILNSSVDIIRSFFLGYWAADGCRKDKQKIGCTRFDNKGQIGTAGLYYLMKRIGYNVSINTRDDKSNIYRLTLTNGEQRKTSNRIKKIQKNEKLTQYVYDIETECGRFAAGIGDIITKNTDSVFLRFKYNRDDFERNRSDTFRLATVCGDNLTEDIFKRPPIELEFEKVFHPFVLLTKKRYIANKYENPKDPFQLKCVDAKGIALTRRDYCPMVKKCYKQVIDTILNDKTSTGESSDTSQDSVKRSTEVYKDFIDKIYDYKIDIDDLVVSAMLASSYKTRPVHVQLAERLKLRKEEVQIGDRIPYIYIESDDPKQQKSELGEDPKYAIKHNLKYNRSCYLEQLAKPILGFYKIVLKDREDLLDEIIGYTNNTLLSCGGKALKPSDFKIDD